MLKAWVWEIPGDYSICGLYSRSSTRSSQWQSEKDLIMALTKRGKDQSIRNTIKNSSVTNAHIPRESLCQSFIPVEWRAFFSIQVPSRLLSQIRGGGTWSRWSGLQWNTLGTLQAGKRVGSNGEKLCYWRSLINVTTCSKTQVH